MGANGAGKTTLLRLVLGLLKPDSGSVRLGGAGRQVRAGYLPQDARATRALNALQYVEYVAYLRGGSSDYRDDAIRAVERVGLAGETSGRTTSLSLGTFRRLGIAAAIVGDPDILLLDEPTASLDPVQRREMRALIGEIGNDRVTILATHLLEDAAALATRVVVLGGTRVVFQGSPEEMRRLSPTMEASIGQSLESALTKMIEEGRDSDGD